MVAVGEVEADTVVLRIVGGVLEIGETAGHAEMERQHPAVVELDEEMLAVLTGPAEAAALEGTAECPHRYAFPQDLRRPDDDALDAPVQRGGVEILLVAGDVGKFRHRTSPSPPPSEESGHRADA